MSESTNELIFKTPKSKIRAWDIIDLLYHGKLTKLSDEEISDFLENEHRTHTWEEYENFCKNFSVICKYLEQANTAEEIIYPPEMRLSYGITGRQNVCAKNAIKKIRDGRKADAVHEFIDLVMDYYKTDFYPDYLSFIKRNLNWDEMMLIEILCLALSED